MALDRSSVTRRDFPTNRKGYDPAAVDAHLASLADRMAELDQRAERSGSSVASTTGEQVRAIVEAAEQSVATMRTDAEAEAREHVARVAEAADTLRSRLEATQRDVSDVLMRLRDGVAALQDDLLALQAGAATVRQAAGADEPAGAEPAVAAPPPFEPAATDLAPPALRSVPAPEPAAAPEPAPAAVEPAAEPSPAAQSLASAGPDDTDAARIVALDLALSGTPRDDADKFLAEHYSLPDRQALLDEVYAVAGA